MIKKGGGSLSHPDGAIGAVGGEVELGQGERKEKLIDKVYILFVE